MTLTRWIVPCRGDHREWNARQDAGRPWAEAVDLLVAEHPERRELIEAFHRRWPEMLAGEIPGTVDVLAELRAAGRPACRAQQLVGGDVPGRTRAVRLPGMVRGDRHLGRGRSEQARPADLRTPRRAVRHRTRAPALFIDDSAANVEAAKRPRATARSSSPTPRRCGANWCDSGSFLTPRLLQHLGNTGILDLKACLLTGRTAACRHQFHQVRSQVRP